MRRLFLLVLVGLLGLGLSAACGVPDHTDPRKLGNAPGAGGALDQPTNVRLPSPTGINGPRDLLERYLQAAAKGDWDPANRDQRATVAADYAKQFLTDDAKRVWQPGKQIVVVDADLLNAKEGDNYVTANLRPVGILDDYGSVTDLSQLNLTTNLAEYRFEARRESGPGGELRLTKVPDLIMLSTNALRDLYAVRPIYFWDTNDANLVPDRRYLAQGVTPEKGIREALDRLAKGPSVAVKEAVKDLPAAKKDNPEVSDTRITVNLTALTNQDKSSYAKIAAQLRWSLLPASRNRSVELKVENRTQYTDSGTGYQQWNLADQSDLDDKTRLYGVVRGQVVRAAGNEPSAGTQRVPAVLSAPENSAVQLAAVSLKRDSAALVRQPPGAATPELWLGRNRTSTGPEYLKVDGLAGLTGFSRPSYLPVSSNRVMLVAGGSIWDVGPGPEARQVQMPPNYPPPTSVAVAADGRQLAIAAGDRAYLALIDPEDSPIKLGKLRELLLPPNRIGPVVGVAWPYEHQLVVAGATTLTEISVDNAFVSPIVLENNDNTQFTQVCAMPRDPVDNVRGSLYVEAKPAGSEPSGYYVFARTKGQIPPPGQSVPPSPSVSPSAGKAGTNATPSTLRAPFFADVT